MKERPVIVEQPPPIEDERESDRAEDERETRRIKQLAEDKKSKEESLFSQSQVPHHHPGHVRRRRTANRVAWP